MDQEHLAYEYAQGRSVISIHTIEMDVAALARATDARGEARHRFSIAISSMETINALLDAAIAAAKALAPAADDRELTAWLLHAQEVSAAHLALAKTKQSSQEGVINGVMACHRHIIPLAADERGE